MTKATPDLLNQLRDSLSSLEGGICLAFSGGVDSALLLKVASELGGPVHAVTLYTPLHSPLEPEEAARLAGELGAAHQVIRIDEIPPELRDNPTDRCYLCKRSVFAHVRDYAKQNGLRWVVDGTNADDLLQYRPGLRALKELEVQSPLAQLGIPKTEVRRMAAFLGLEVASKPSAPCLATRFPYGCPISREALAQADRMEQAIRSLGIATLRARIHGRMVRLEVNPGDFETVLRHRETIVSLVEKEGFVTVALDLLGFQSGTMDRLYFGKDIPQA